jgi:hypothetical protein
LIEEPLFFLPGITDLHSNVRFEETTRPDGIDLDLLTPKAADAIAAPPSDFLGIAWRRGRKHALGETAVDLTARR